MKRTRASWPMRASTTVLLAALALSGACAKQSTAPIVPPPPLPPEIVAVSPPSRARFVHFDAPIWAQFVAPLDPATVTPQNVFLKIDTQRLSCAVGWEAATQRIHITPLVALKLLQTYTVELSPNLRTADHQPLGDTFWWQYTTTSVHIPVPVAPLDRWFDSPFVALKWAGNETTPGTLSYELYVAPDSAAVASRSIAPALIGTAKVFYPRTRWREFGPNYWSITVVNATVGERYDGPVWRWDTPGADVPVDTVGAPIVAWGWYDRGTREERCESSRPAAIDLRIGPNTLSTLVWDKTPANSRILAGARLELRALPAFVDSLPAEAALHTIQNPNWRQCLLDNSRYVPNDEANGHLASGAVAAPGVLRFETDSMICHFEQFRHRTDVFGYQFHALGSARFGVPTASDPALRPALSLYVYRMDPGPIPDGSPAPAAVGRARVVRRAIARGGAAAPR